jgi:hypothetical protein
LIDWLIMMERYYVSELRPPKCLFFIPGWYLRWRAMVIMLPTGVTPDPFIRALWQSYQQRHLGQVGGMGERVRILPIGIWNTSRERRKILWHGTSSFTSRPKEGVLRIFIALKNPSPRPGLNPRPLGPVTSTLTTTPPRRLKTSVLYTHYKQH